MSNAIREIVGPESNHGADNRSPKKVLLIVANPSVSEMTGWPIGAWAAEVTHPYFEFQQAGYEITIASPAGGKIEWDGFSDPRHESGYSASDLISLGFINSPQLIALMEDTAKLSDLDPSNFDAIFLAGGQSPMYTFRGNQALMDFVTQFYELGRPTAIVCHATSILLDTTLSDGQKLVAGKSWTGFADAEEQVADQVVGQRIQPFWIETEARKMTDTTFQVKSPFTPYAIKDGHLITGQQQNSGGVAAELIIEALEG